MDYRDERHGFEWAITMLKAGQAVRRASWPDEVKAVVLVPGSDIVVREGAPFSMVVPVGLALRYRPHIDVHTGDNEFGPWAPECADLLAEDWVLWE